MTPSHILSYATRQALSQALGDAAGRELGDALDLLARRLQAVERDKVDVIRIVPEAEGQHEPRLQIRRAAG